MNAVTAQDLADELRNGESLRLTCRQGRVTIVYRTPQATGSSSYDPRDVESDFVEQLYLAQVLARGVTSS